MIRWFNHFGKAAALAALLLSAAGGEARAASAAASSRHADAGRNEGTVVAIDAGDLIVDLGASSGAAQGTTVELWRPLRLKHPVTGQVLVDRFKIGTLRLVQVRPTFTLAKVESATRTPAAGDVVVVTQQPQASSTVSGPTATAAAEIAAVAPPPTVVITNAPALDPETKELTDLVVALRGATPSQRIAAYEAYERAHPQSRYAPALRDEVTALRGAPRDEVDPGAAPAANEPDVASGFDEPRRTRAHEPLDLAIELAPRFHGAVLHARADGEAAYASLPMKAAGPGYWTATLPASIVRAPDVEYFVEGVDANGVATPLVGTASEPRSTTVEDPDRVVHPRKLRATAAAWSDYASFDSRSAQDYVWQTEGWFGLRFGDDGVRALRSGFGVYRGRGGTLHELDDLHLTGRSVGLTYGYLETEIAFTPLYAVIGRGVIGLREDGLAGGAQGFFRVGNDLRTNLLLGGEVLGGIGLRGIVELDWNTLPRVPVVLRTEVTNQPAGFPAQTSGVSTGTGEIGARAIVQAGYRFADALTLSARVSYQGRTINHAGPGAGAAVSTTW